MIAYIVAISVLFVISAISNAVMDKISHHYSASIFSKLNPDWWNPAYSWINKYKNPVSKEPKFFLSTSLLVFVTDAWHFFQFIMLTSLQIIIGLSINLIFDLKWYYVIVIVIALKILWGGIFTLFYSKLFNLKK